MPTAKPAAPFRWLSTALILLFSAVPVCAADFVHGPYSGAPAADSIVISWMPSEPAPARIEFGLRSEYEAGRPLSSHVDVPLREPDSLHETTHVRLENLAPDADYVYRVALIQTDSETVSPPGSFSTAPKPGELVMFAVLADTQQQLEGTNRPALVGDGITRDPHRFDFILHGGDVVDSPASFYWDDWFASFREMLRRAPFIPILGNHEEDDLSYYDAFEFPPGAGREDERWWALHWGDVVVVGLDSNVTSVDDYRAQLDWLREHLVGDEPHKFVILHHPVFTSDAYHSSGSFLDEIYHPVFVETDVDIVFNANAHIYERIERDGVTYLIVGGGGAAPHRGGLEAIQGSDVFVEGVYFYTRVHTDTAGVRVETVAVARELPDGTCEPTDEIIDSFFLEGRPSTEAITWDTPGTLLGVGLVVLTAALLVAVALWRERR